jgi:hypothetical protein
MARTRFFPVPPRLTSTDLSVTRPDPGTTERKEPGWERRRREANESTREAMAALSQMNAHLGGLLSLAKAPPLNDVMAQVAGIIPATGTYHLEFPSRYSALSVANLSPSLLSTGAAAPVAGTNPAVGAEIVRVPPGCFKTWPARGNGVSLNGQPGSPFDLTVFSRPRPPTAGLCSRSAGGVLIPAGATTSLTVTNFGAGLGHVAVVLNVSAVTGSVQVSINGVTPSGYVYPLLVGIAVTAVGVTPYRIGPSFTPSPNAVADDLVPEIIQVVTTVVATATYGVDLVAGA